MMAPRERGKLDEDGEKMLPVLKGAGWKGTMEGAAERTEEGAPEGVAEEAAGEVLEGLPKKVKVEEEPWKGPVEDAGLVDDTVDVEDDAAKVKIEERIEMEMADATLAMGIASLTASQAMELMDPWSNYGSTCNLVSHDYVVRACYPRLIRSTSAVEQPGWQYWPTREIGRRGCLLLKQRRRTLRPMRRRSEQQ